MTNEQTPAPDLRAATREFLRANVVNAKIAHDESLKISAVTKAAHEAAVRALADFGGV